MSAAGARDGGRYDQRRTHRVKLSVPVHLCPDTAQQEGAGYAYAGRSENLSTGGVYLRTRDGGPFVPGEILQATISIPPASRRVFPFSRIAGSCRVIRVETLSPTTQEQGLALAFCGNTTFLRASVRSSALEREIYKTN